MGNAGGSLPTQECTSHEICTELGENWSVGSHFIRVSLIWSSVPVVYTPQRLETDLNQAIGMDAQAWLDTLSSVYSVVSLQ